MVDKLRTALTSPTPVPAMTEFPPSVRLRQAVREFMSLANKTHAAVSVPWDWNQGSVYEIIVDESVVMFADDEKVRFVDHVKRKNPDVASLVEFNWTVPKNTK